MASTAEFEPGESLWTEAVASVQADLDADVHAEANGLVVAEMADVTSTDRFAALKRGTTVVITTLNGGTVRGPVHALGSDHLVVAQQHALVLVPMHAVSVVSPVPRVLAAEPATRRAPAWRAAARNLLGQHVSVDLGVTRLGGVLTWVGRDHIDLQTDGGAKTVMWSAVMTVEVRS